MFHARLNIFSVFINYRDVDFALRCIDVLATNAQISMNRNLMLNCVKLKQRIFKRHASSYWPDVGVGDIEKIWIFNLLASACDPKKPFWPIRLEFSEPCCRGVKEQSHEIVRLPNRTTCEKSCGCKTSLQFYLRFVGVVFAYLRSRIGSD